MATGRLKVWNARVGAWDYVSPGELGGSKSELAQIVNNATAEQPVVEE